MQVDTTTFGSALESGLRARSLSLSGLRDRLEERGATISLTSLSYWRADVRRPDLKSQYEVVSAIEDVLQVGAGTLAGLAARNVRLPSLEAPDLFLPMAGRTADVRALLADAQAELRATPTAWFRELSVQQITDVGVDGRPEVTTLQVLVQCVDGRLERIVFGTTSFEGCGHMLTFTALGGGSIVERYLSANRDFAAVSFQFDRPLEVGDTGMLVIRTDYEPGMPVEPRTWVGINRRAQKVINWVRFAPGAIPAWCVEAESTPDGESRAFRGLDDDRSIHQVRWDFGPGGLALDWGDGDPPALAG